MTRWTAAVLVLFASTAHAQTAPGRTAALGWARLPGAEACPSTQQVAQATEALLGRAAFVAATDASMAIEGRVEPYEHGFRATLAVTDASGAAIGERVVDTEGGCDALLTPLSIVLATLVDPDAPPLAPPPSPAVEEQPPIVETRIVTERVEVPVPVRAPSWRLDVDLSAVLAVGATPFTSAGGETFLFLTPPGFVPIGLHGWIVPWSRADLGAGDYVDQLTAWAGLTICPLAARDESLAFAACAGLDVGGVFVIGEHGSQPLTEHERITGGADISVRGRVHAVGPLWFVLAAALLIPFRTDAFLRGAPATPYYGPEHVALVVTLGPSLALDL